MSDSVILNHSAVELWFPMDSWGEPKSLVVFSSKFHDIFYVWKLNAEKPKKQQETFGNFSRIFSGISKQTNKRITNLEEQIPNLTFLCGNGTTTPVFRTTAPKRAPKLRSRAASAALTSNSRFVFFKYIQIKYYIYKSLCIYFNY